MPVSVEATDYGFRSVVFDVTDVHDVRNWPETVKVVLGDRPTFSQLIDMRRQSKITGADVMAATV